MASMELLAWHRAFGQAVEKLDGPGFWLSIIRLLKTRVSFQTWMAVVFSSTRPVQILGVSSEAEGSDEKRLRDYCNGLYLLDPFYIAIGERFRHGLYRLDDVAPDCFSQTEYYRRYFQLNVVKDEVQFNVELDQDRTLGLSLGSRQAYDEHSMGVLAMVQPWLLPLMRQRLHFEASLSSSAYSRSPGVFNPEFPTAKATLTDRESEVGQLMLSGCSTKVIARRLNISIETVRSHKKHLYHKLGVNTQSELFALFWSRYSSE